jgi:hypothetical protein
LKFPAKTGNMNFLVIFEKKSASIKIYRLDVSVFHWLYFEPDFEKLKHFSFFFDFLRMTHIFQFSVCSGEPIKKYVICFNHPLKGVVEAIWTFLNCAARINGKQW